MKLPAGLFETVVHQVEHGTQVGLDIRDGLGHRQNLCYLVLELDLGNFSQQTIKHGHPVAE